jgi:cytochrome c oxidase cbb3-type subunit I/II
VSADDTTQDAKGRAAAERTVEMREIVYDDDVVRAFILASVGWGIVSLLLGVIIATQLVHWQANFGLPWLTFGRLRPLHTNAAIFAFVGNMMFAGIYHSTQRLVKARMASDVLSWINFWGWQLIIVGAAITIPLGLTQSKEYAELIWPIDILVAVVWVVFAVNFFWTLARRNEKNLYVALWFYIATIVTIPVLYIINNLALPTGFFHSYSIYGGVQDALVQWWYGHNAVGFFLTTPILGIMYYYLPKAAERPVYSYRLSVVHFWALVFVYIWAGPHHLLNTALPAWAQTLGMVFSVMLWAPSWGGMLNGLLTLRGAWDKLRTDPVIRFLIAGVTFYGMSTFEGPLLAVRSVNGLAHYTDWIIGHVHGGTLGWNGFMAAGMFYWLVPRLWRTRLFSTRLAETHFWLGLMGILLYVGAMWVSGVNQGLYWQALDAEGFLKYPDFVEGLLSARILWQMRLVGGILYFSGFVLMGVNLLATIRSGVKERVVVRVPALVSGPAVPAWRLLSGTPVILGGVILVMATLLVLATPVTAPAALTGVIALAVAAILYIGLNNRQAAAWHRMLEGRPLAFTILTLIAILIGGVAELIPSVVIHHEVPAGTVAEAETVAAGGAGAPAPSPTGKAPGAAGAVVQPVESKYAQLPYSPLELEGRDIYVREGCYNCHSQMIRPFRHETLRYGEYSRAESYRYDHPFQWGSKRTGPDLHREGGRYPNLWHYEHLSDPRSTSPGSNMPRYAWLKEGKVKLERTRGKLIAMRKLGVPYTDQEIDLAVRTARSQGTLIAADLAQNGVKIDPESPMVALIAYLQRLGRGPQPTAPPEPAAASSPDAPGAGGENAS